PGLARPRASPRPWNLFRTHPGDPSSPTADLTQGDAPRRIRAPGCITRSEWGAAGRAGAGWNDCGVSPQRTWGACVASVYYEIRIAGVLPAEALLDCDRLSASVHQVETVVHGPLQDQAALHGLLARLETFGVQVLEVRRLEDDT